MWRSWSRSRIRTTRISTASGSPHEFFPDKITIFRRPLVRAFPDPDELEEEIRITVLHELAHYFGIDEDRLDELGYS